MTHILIKMLEASLGPPLTSQGIVSLQILKMRNLEKSIDFKEGHKNG